MSKIDEWPIFVQNTRIMCYTNYIISVIDQILQPNHQRHEMYI